MGISAVDKAIKSVVVFDMGGRGRSERIASSVGDGLNVLDRILTEMGRPVQTSVYIPIRIIRKVERMAEKHGLSVSEIFRTALIVTEVIKRGRDGQI